MQALALDSGNSFGENRGAFQLSLRAQIATGIAIIAVLVGSFILTESLIPIAVILGGFVVFATVRNPVASLFAFIVINVILTLRGRDNGEPTVLDLALGIVLALIMAYWLLRLRFFERQSLSTSKGQLALVLFAVWSLIVTLVGLSGEHTTLNFALRELLNLSPFLAIPIIYYNFVEFESPSERWLILSVLLSGIIIVVWNFFRLRSNVLRAVYLYQTGRGNSNEMISGLIVLIATSILMDQKGFWKTLLAVLLLLLGILGIIISFRRNLYVGIIICMIGVVLLGDLKERRRGIKRLLVSGLCGIIGLLPFYFQSRTFRLLLMNYGLRFISSQHLGTDLSLRMRFVEWKYEWQDILQSPILGHGFGTKFRIFDIVRDVHYWMPFSHSSYLYMVFKSGFIGAILFLGAFFSILFKGFRLLKSHSLPLHAQIILRASLGFLFAILINAYTEPSLGAKTDLTWVGLIWGYFLVLEKNIESIPNQAIILGVA